MFSQRGSRAALVAVSSLAGAIILAAGAAYAWSGPTATPPSGNTAAPINTSASAQSKSGSLTVGGEIIGTLSSGYGQLRMVKGNYGSFFRNDGTNTYLLLTDSGNQYGTWNSLRPFTVNNNTGNVTVGTSLWTKNLCISGVCRTSWPTNGLWTQNGTELDYNGGNVAVGAGNIAASGKVTANSGFASSVNITNSASSDALDGIVYPNITTSGTFYNRGGTIGMHKTIAGGVSDSGYADGLWVLSMRNFNPSGVADNGTLSTERGIDVVYGNYNSTSASPNTTSATGIQIDPYALTGTIGSMYDLYLNSGGTASNHWGIYQAGSSVNNYFAGDVGIGTASPGYALNVYGKGNTWAGVFHSAGSYGLYADNTSGYYAELANGSWGVYTNGNVYASNVYSSAIGLYMSQLRLSQQLGAATAYAGTACPSSNYVMYADTPPGTICVMEYHGECTETQQTSGNVGCRQILY